MKVIFARHGNTFQKEQTPVFIGKEQDLALTEEGLEQARRLAVALKLGGNPPARIICSQLQRTQDFGKKINELFHVNLEIDERLNEISYGQWAGLSRAEVVTKFGLPKVAAWEEELLIPADAGFLPSANVLESEAQSILESIKSTSLDAILCVSSNARLAFIYRAIVGQNNGRMRTGHYGIIENSSGDWEVKCWNVDPRSVLETYMTNPTP